jgi:hypothetical protein
MLSASPRAMPPPPTPQAPGEVYAKATDDFDASDDRELTFRKGDVIHILAQDPVCCLTSIHLSPSFRSSLRSSSCLCITHS